MHNENKEVQEAIILKGQRVAQVNLLGEAELEALEGFMDETTGYFYKMLDYLKAFIQAGVKAERFTEQEAQEALDIALWYSYACNNIDDYAHYYMATQWMPASEKYAQGCGTWYYRYACALMYCGKLEQAQAYVEKGVQEEPSYPWGWLTAAKLRYYFGDKTGALAAVAQGLELEPGDFEFLTLRREIEEGRSLEEMEYHYINPQHDQQLQGRLLAESDEKQQAIAGIVCNSAGLQQIKELLQPKDWQADCPYCSFHMDIVGQDTELVFRMNEAALSKLDLDWLREQKERLDQGDYQHRKDQMGHNYELYAVVIDLDYSMGLIYYDAVDQITVAVAVELDEKTGMARLLEPDWVDVVLTEERMEVSKKNGKPCR